MNEQSQLLAAIISAPDESTPRLVYADWLDENNGPVGHAELIRLQCDALQRIPLCMHRKAVKGCDRCRVKSRELACLTAATRVGGVRRLPWGTVSRRAVQRGFVHRVRVLTQDFAAAVDQVIWHPGQNRPCPITAQPIREVELTNFVRGPRGFAPWIWSRLDQLGLTYRDTLGRTFGDVAPAIWPGVRFVVIPDTTLIGEAGLPIFGWEAEPQEDSLPDLTSPQFSWVMPLGRLELSIRVPTQLAAVDTGTRIGPIESTDRRGRRYRCEAVIVEVAHDAEQDEIVYTARSVGRYEELSAIT